MKEKERPIEAPCFLNDLGVRSFNSPKIAYKHVLNKLNIKEFSTSLLYEDLNILTLNNIGYYLDIYILLTGDYDCPYDYLVTKKEELLLSSDYRNSVLLGSLFAAKRNNYAVDLFKHAGNISDNIENKVVALHREIAYLIKRENKNSINILFFELLTMIMKIDETWKRNIYYALSNNLYALLLVKNKDSYQTIYQLLLSSEALVDTTILLKDKVANNKSNNQLFDEAMRYRSQIEMNLANILIYDDKLIEAERVLYNNFIMVKESSPDYLSEAAATYAYILYKNKKYKKAVEFSDIAIKEYQKIGDILKVENVRKTKIAALYKQNRIEDAEKEYDSLKE